MVEQYDTDDARIYYDAVLHEAESLNEILVETEKQSGWGTGASGRISLSVAQVYKNGFYQLVDKFYTDFIFDPDSATEEYWSGT